MIRDNGAIDIAEYDKQSSGNSSENKSIIPAYNLRRPIRSKFFQGFFENSIANAVPDGQMKRLSIDQRGRNID